MSKTSRPEISRPGTNKKKVESNKSKNKKNQMISQMGEKAFYEQQIAEKNAKLNQAHKKERKAHAHPLIIDNSNTNWSFDCGCVLNARVYQDCFEKLVQRAISKGTVFFFFFVQKFIY